MTTVKLWLTAVLLLVIVLAGAQFYEAYVSTTPREVWRLAGTMWVSWAAWHSFRLFLK
jgi:hypothetical protein